MYICAKDNLSMHGNDERRKVNNDNNAVIMEAQRTLAKYNRA